MAELDASRHSLNLSTSKQKYSFPKTKRFNDNEKSLCDSLYQLPSMLANRTTMLGYGKKKMGPEDITNSPGVGAYKLESQINPEKNRSRCVSFGVSREKMEQGGALGLLRFTKEVPSPCVYEAKDVRDMRGAISLKIGHSELSFDKNLKIPGPGTYEYEAMGTNRYYLSSRFKNTNFGKISQVSRLQPLSLRKPAVGPADYKELDSMNLNGRYALAKHSSAVGCIIPKANRKGLVEQTQLKFPGPGQYNSFSGFG